MSGDPGDDSPPGGRPYAFPLTAIDRLSPPPAWDMEQHVPVTIETTGVLSALSYVDGYLGTGSGPPPTGSWKSMLITGSLGIGKTHLAQLVAQRMAQEGSSKVRLVVIDSPVGDFATLYRTVIVDQIDRFDLYERLKDYYADVVAKDLSQSRSGKELAEGLSERRYDPRKVVEKLGLVESVLHEQLRRYLLGVTEVANFSKAFTLALIPEYEQSVWEWLQGRSVPPRLQAHGITSLIEDETSAFRALGMLAFLYGRVGHKFVLIIDEFDKLLMGSDDRRRLSLLHSVERLLNVFIDSGGLAVLCALPDIQRVLLSSTRERLRTIRLSPFTVEDLTRYAHRVLGDQASLFPAEALAYAVDLTGGNPRQVLSLCGSAWNRARNDDLPVSTDIVRAAVREQYERASHRDVRASVRQVIQAGGWHFETDHRIDDELTVDFWIPLWESGPALALLIVGSLLNEEDLAELRRRLRPASTEVILIVNGYLSAALRESASALIGRQPLIYTEEPFLDTLRQMLAATLTRLENAAQENIMTILQRRLERLALQQSFTQSLLEQMSGRIDRLGGEANRRLTHIEREITRVPSRLMPDSGSGAVQSRSRSVRLPEEVEDHFDRALAAVNALAGLNDLFTDAFSALDTGRQRRRMASRALFEAAGVAVIYQRLLEAFREAVADWMDTVRSGGSGHPPDRQEQDRLRLICRTYMTTAEVLPLFQLESLAAFAPLSAESGTDQTGRLLRRGEATEALNNLGERVLKSALAAALEGGREHRAT